MIERINSTLTGTQMSEKIKSSKVADPNEASKAHHPRSPPRRILDISAVYSPMKHNFQIRHGQYHNVMLHDPSIQQLPHHHEISKASLAQQFDGPVVLSDVYQQQEVN